MVDSIRQRIIDAVDTRFKAILKTGGYKTDIGNHVHDWLSRTLDPSELPALIYKDTTNNLNRADLRTKYNNKIQLEIELKAETAATTAESLREMIEDVYKAIGTDEGWSTLAQYSEPISEEITLERADKIVGSAKLVIEIMYLTKKWGY